LNKKFYRCRANRAFGTDQSEGLRLGLIMPPTGMERSAVRRVPEGDIAQAPFLWTRGIAARETLRYLDRNGIDAEPMLSKAELSRVQLIEDPGGVSAVSQHRFLEIAAAETNDPLLGLHVAAIMDLREIGLLFYLAASSETVAEALEYVARYAATATAEIRLEISRQKDETLLTFRRVLASDAPIRQQSELLALGFVRVLRKLTNRNFTPSRMSFVHARGSELREVHRILRCPVEFLQPTDSLVLPQQVMGLPIISEDRRLLQILEAHADVLLSERHTTTRVRDLVEDQLVGTLPSGAIGVASIAEQLGMSERSLRRRLAAEGTSFGEVLDHLRHRLALRYLQDEHVSLKQVAWLLGYSEAGAFNHAFKRWTGIPPGRARCR
jgi:AraC-like DNA-binding protein